jgi:hypothetical protein
MNGSINRSTFVTRLAWIFIILAGFTTLISIVQTIMVNVMFPIQQMTDSIENAPAQDMPRVFRFLFPHFRFFSFTLLVISAITFVSAIGLLRRKNWARIIFVVILALGIVWSLFCVVIQFTMFLVDPGFPPGPQSAQFHLMVNIIQVFTLLMAIGIGVLFGWIIRKLNSAPIKAEFLVGPLAS